jgi:hypothetical protein
MKNLSLSEKEKYFSSICTSMGLTPYDLNSQTDSQLIKLHIDLLTYKSSVSDWNS